MKRGEAGKFRAVGWAEIKKKRSAMIVSNHAANKERELNNLPKQRGVETLG